MGVFLGGDPDMVVARLDGRLVTRVAFDGVVGFKHVENTNAHMYARLDKLFPYSSFHIHIILYIHNVAYLYRV